MWGPVKLLPGPSHHQVDTVLPVLAAHRRSPRWEVHREDGVVESRPLPPGSQHPSCNFWLACVQHIEVLAFDQRLPDQYRDPSTLVGKPRLRPGCMESLMMRQLLRPSGVPEWAPPTCARQDHEVAPAEGLADVLSSALLPQAARIPGHDRCERSPEVPFCHRVEVTTPLLVPP